MRHRASTYRLLISACIIIAFICNIFPVHDKPFEKYIISQVTHNKDEFNDLLKKAHDRVDNEQSRTLFLAIRDVANDDRIDVSKFFHKKNVADIKNLTKKNAILLDSLLADSKSKIKQGLDIKGGISCVLQVNDKKFNDLGALERAEQLNKAMDIIRQRIDGLGVSEPLVRSFGNNCIEIQLPGVSTKDNPELVDIIKKPAKLSFHLLHPTLIPTSRNDRAPLGYEIMAFEQNNSDNMTIEQLAFVKRIPEMTGSMVKQAGVRIGQYGEYEIALSMTEEGTKKFEHVTSSHINQQLGIVLDGKLYSAPYIRSAITDGHASISGKFSQRDAIDLANVLNNPLDVELKFIELNEIGPSLAEDAKSASMKAAYIGASVVMLFMIGYYRVAGIVAILSVLANIAIVMGTMVTIGATLTLPGIAALVLTIGMAVDANILIFERMREEQLAGKPLLNTLLSGHNKALWTILDANITTLLTAIILICFGTGAIKGFGIILSIGLFATVFCALVLCRGMLEQLAESGHVKRLIPNINLKLPIIDFLKHTKAVFVVYGCFLLIGLAAIVLRNDKIYGIDFTGGDEITLQFEQKIPTQEIVSFAHDIKIDEVIPVYQRSLKDNTEVLRIQTSEGQSTKLFDNMQSKFDYAGLSVVKQTAIGSSIGHGTTLNALASILLSMIGIMIYVAFRFEIGYGIGAVVSTLLDVIATIIIYLALGKQISSAMVAAVLMVVGYSINDTIIVFDRIREELRSHSSKSLREIINLSITRTLSRTILTSSSTLLAALSLYLFGSGVIVDFALVFLIGIIVGTFSSIFIASPIFFLWHKGDKRTIVGISQS